MYISIQLILFYITNIIIAQEIITALNDFENSVYDVLTGKTSSTEKDFNPDGYLTTPQIIRRNGYKAVSHTIQTQDGYLLTLHRIPENKKGQVGKQPVFIHHGAFGSSADFVITGNRSLAFILSDFGYDVWLGNCRGNTYSNGHISLPPDSLQFWNFSFHEIGIYDLPASLNYIRSITKANGKIIYIGHSMGTTVFFVFASMLPEIAEDTVKIMVGLAPAAFMKNVRSPLRLLAPYVTELNWVFKHMGLKQFVLNKWLLAFLQYDCELTISKELCRETVFLFCGYDQDQLEKGLIPIILGHDPAGMSIKTLIHFGQIIHNNGEFRQYDYDAEGNNAKYGTNIPPAYEVKNIKIPTYFMYGDNDLLVGVDDVLALSRNVNESVGVYRVPLKSFNHIDFLWAKDVIELVYNNLTNTIKKYALA